ncbi:MAG: hypothetical protein H7122_13710 [Chitinophagaceae bacterium]|nr:hypothetical protein [Chitinophagaceae bacterium]
MKANRSERVNSADFSNDENSHSRTRRDSERPANTEDEAGEFPGYPHYPAKDDIMHPSNKMEKISPDLENLTKSGAYMDPKKTDRHVSSSLETPAYTDDELIIVPGTEADVTKEDLLILGEQDIDNEEERSLDIKILSGDLDADLDVPGEELDDANEDIGEEDEENNYYSLGGDRQENLEEN